MYLFGQIASSNSRDKTKIDVIKSGEDISMKSIYLLLIYSRILTFFCWLARASRFSLYK